MLLSNLPAIRIYDTRTVDLWDATSGRKLTKLDLEGEIQSVSFSPDDSLFAVTSVRQNKDQSSTFHLRTWETKSGKFVHELMPLENVDHDEIGDPMWGVNGKYLLAPIREGRIGTYVIGIWNVQSGRYRGGFSGCDYSDDPFSNPAPRAAALQAMPRRRAFHVGCRCCDRQDYRIRGLSGAGTGTSSNCPFLVIRSTQGL
jgi:hypothetical protein